MEMDNVCRFVPARKGQALHILNLVYETKAAAYNGLNSEATYKMHLVVGGSGRLHTPGKTEPLQTGDLFFSRPAVPFAIESEQDLQYIYISFLGDRANLFIDQLRISGNHCLFAGFADLQPMLEQALRSEIQVADVYCEGILLYAFARLGEHLFPKERKEKEKGDAADRIKKYIDEQFSDAELSLEQIGNALNYNKKYISAVFKSKFKIGVADYLRNVRLQHACTLMEQGFSSVKDIAYLCGFSDPLYFSKVFKYQLGKSPREHIAALKKDLE